MKKQAGVVGTIIDDAADIITSETGRDPLNFMDRETASSLVEDMIENAMERDKDAYIEELSDSIAQTIEEIDTIEEQDREEQEEIERRREEKEREQEELMRRDREQRTSKLDFNWS